MAKLHTDKEGVVVLSILNGDQQTMHLLQQAMDYRTIPSMPA